MLKDPVAKKVFGWLVSSRVGEAKDIAELDNIPKRFLKSSWQGNLIRIILGHQIDS